MQNATNETTTPPATETEIPRPPTASRAVLDAHAAWKQKKIEYDRAQAAKLAAIEAKLAEQRRAEEAEEQAIRDTIEIDPLASILGDAIEWAKGANVYRDMNAYGRDTEANAEFWRGCDAMGVMLASLHFAHRVRQDNAVKAHRIAKAKARAEAERAVVETTDAPQSESEASE